ncbi:hypothetical protein SNK03_012453 [Fusarium graminearum]
MYQVYYVQALKTAGTGSQHYLVASLSFQMLNESQLSMRETLSTARYCYHSTRTRTSQWAIVLDSPLHGSQFKMPPRILTTAHLAKVSVELCKFCGSTVETLRNRYFVQV